MASSGLFPEDMGREGAGAELRRLPNDKVGNGAGREGAVEVGVGAGDGPVLLICWLPNEKLALLPLRDVPPKLIAPEGPVLVKGRVPKTPVEELPELVLLAAGGAAVVAVTEEVTGGSTGFPNIGGLEKLNPEGTLEGLAGWALGRFVDETLLVGFAESSAWPTRSPEKLPSVSPVRELGNRSSPNLDGGVSSLLEVVASAIPEGAVGLPLEEADSPAEVLGADTAPAGGELSGMGS